MFTTGQRVHVLLSMNDRRYRNREPFAEGTITRVGRKYVYATWSGRTKETKFDQSGHQATDYSGCAATLMTDEMRAGYERSANLAARFKALRLAGMYSDLNRFSIDTVEAVLSLLETDEANRS